MRKLMVRMVNRMKTENDWNTILNECRKAVQKKISPLLKEITEPQSDYGIGAGGDPIKKVDLEAETAIINTIKESNISFTLISEESGIIEIGKKPKENYIVVDPIDGSTNFSRRLPFYATSIAVSNDQTLGGIHTALVSDLARNHTYIANKKHGAYKNGERIEPSEIEFFENAIIGVDLNTNQLKTLKSLTKVLTMIQHLRHFGANALELCFVADGTLDAFIDIRGKLRITDLAAAFLIVKESGAKISTSDETFLTDKTLFKKRIALIAAGNSKIYSQLIRALPNYTKDI
jgi:myo-inositol-1(or 4)-monophosphatase